MNILFEKRQTGTTSRLIQLSADTGYTLICANLQRAKMAEYHARVKGIVIPKPISTDQLFSRT